MVEQTGEQRGAIVHHLFVGVLLGAAVGCGGAADGEAPGVEQEPEEAHHSSLCGEVGGEVDEYEEGMTRLGQGGEVSLVSSEPAQPDRGDNRWRLMVSGAEGAAVEGAEVSVEPFMPAHGHGTSPATFDATPAGEGGVYDVGPFDLFMPGLWEVSVHVEPEGEESWEVEFRFCVEG